MPEATATPQPMLADVDDFVAWVQGQRERYEFVGGRLVMMAGGSEDHSDIQVNLLTSLKRCLRSGPCRPNGSDLLIRIDDRTGRLPDASVTCGREGRHYVTAPVAISRSSRRRPSLPTGPTSAETIRGSRAFDTTS